jgi:hypothetical protein
MQDYKIVRIKALEQAAKAEELTTQVEELMRDVEELMTVVSFLRIYSNDFAQEYFLVAEPNSTQLFLDQSRE